MPRPGDLVVECPAPAERSNFPPVWGNVHDTHIQIDPIKFIVIGDLFKEAKIKLPPPFATVLDLEQPVAAAKPKTLGVAELQALYKDKGVDCLLYTSPSPRD